MCKYCVNGGFWNLTFHLWHLESTGHTLSLAPKLVITKAKPLTKAGCTLQRQLPNNLGGEELPGQEEHPPCTPQCLVVLYSVLTRQHSTDCKTQCATINRDHYQSHECMCNGARTFCTAQKATSTWLTLTHTHLYMCKANLVHTFVHEVFYPHDKVFNSLLSLHNPSKLLHNCVTQAAI